MLPTVDLQGCVNMQYQLGRRERTSGLVAAARAVRQPIIRTPVATNATAMNGVGGE